ncbi:MAG: hypothetical protein HQL54_08925 [Magnetococcales bacterium]|nr:hypothetical protein [Magnetococcales bacterium]
MATSEEKTITQLNRILSLLSAIPGKSSEGFSNITEHMGNFSGSFATASTRASSIQERIKADGELGLTPLKSDLRKVYREINGIFKAMEGIVDTMSHFNEHMIHMVDWSMTIEQGMFLPPTVDQIKATSGERLEIQTMGAVIDSLIQQARPLIQDVIQSSQYASDGVNQLSRRILADLDSSLHGMGILRENSNRTLRRLGSSVKSFSKSCGTIDGRSGKVTNVVFEMVQAMQFDDITAQRVSHAVTTIEKIIEKVDDGLNDDDRRWVSIAAHITSHQMTETVNDLLNAIENANGQMLRIEDLATEQVEDIGTIRTTSMTFRQDTADISYHMQALSKLGVFSESLSDEVLSTLSNAENAVFQSKRALNMLTVIAARLDHLASSLKTQGSDRLEILTRSIISLATTIKREGPDRVNDLNNAASRLQAISLAFSDKATPRLVRTNSLLRRAPLSTKQLETNNSDLMGEMNASLADAQATAIQLSLLMAELSFHMDIKETVNKANKGLRTVLHDIGGAETLEGDLFAMAEEFEDLASMYTMDSERRVHNAALDGEDTDTGDDGGDIELF